MINHIWVNEVTPAQWDMALIKMLYKKGDKYDPKNYRGIVLIRTMKKLYGDFFAHAYNTITQPLSATAQRNMASLLTKIWRRQFSRYDT
jgi:hypothetical protein